MKTKPPTIDARRTTDAKLKAEILGLTSERRNPDETHAALSAHVEDLAQKGRAGLGQRVVEIAAGDTPTRLLEGLDNPKTAAQILCAVLTPERVLQALELGLSRVPDGPDSTQRHERIKALEAELFAAEVAEEQEVCRLEALGQQVDRRADADPAAVLFRADDAEAA
jgi:hypothetical protein